jgi:proteasome lid subunit RPN8/RPN11
VIVLPEAHRAAIVGHAESDPSEECCGLMLGRFSDDGTKIVQELMSIDNARESGARHNRFLIGPMEMLKGERQARSLGLDVVGIYHSHPNAPAVPSQFDLDHAWPVYSYVIVAVTAQGAGALRSWALREDRSGFDEEDIAATTDDTGSRR